MRAPSVRAGFSLIELVSVMLILGVLAASAIPAVSTIADFKAQATRSEVRSYLGFARGTAATTGLPTGVRINLITQLMFYVQILAPGDSPTTMLDANDQERSPTRINRYGGPDVTNVLGVGQGGAVRTIWFGYAGIPQQRDSNGTLIQNAPADVVISFTAGDDINVRAHTGLVE